MENKDVNVKLKPKLLLCQEHELELNFYCETCKRLVCHYCITKAHSNHKHNTAKEVANKYRKEMDEIMEPVQKVISKVSDVCQQVSMTRDRIQNRLLKLKSRSIGIISNYSEDYSNKDLG